MAMIVDQVWQYIIQVIVGAGVAGLIAVGLGWRAITQSRTNWKDLADSWEARNEELADTVKSLRDRLTLAERTYAETIKAHDTTISELRVHINEITTLNITLQLQLKDRELELRDRDLTIEKLNGKIALLESKVQVLENK